MKMCDMLKNEADLILQEIKRLSGKPLKGVSVEFEYVGNVGYNTPCYDIVSGYLIPAFYKKNKRMFETKDFMQQIADLTDCVVVAGDYQYLPTRIVEKHNVKEVYVNCDSFIGATPIKGNKHCEYVEHFSIATTAAIKVTSDYLISLGYDNTSLLKYPYSDERFDLFIDNPRLSDILKETKEKFNIDGDIALFYDRCENLYVNYVIPENSSTVSDSFDFYFYFAPYLREAFIHPVKPLLRKVPSDAKKYLKERLKEIIKEEK